MIIIKYASEEEAHRIISEKTSEGYTLAEVQNITEGNFLGFKEPNEPENEAPLIEELNNLKIENTELKLAMADLAEAQEADKTEIQLALAEIAELIVGGA